MIDRKRGGLAAVPAGPTQTRRAVAAIIAARRFRIACVQASAGWGKTTAVREALSGDPHLWVDLAEAPHESGALVFALAQVFGIATPALGAVLHEARESGSVQSIIEWFLSFRPAWEREIVLDDLHLLAEDRLSLDFLAALIKRARDSRWVLISRYAVRLPFATWLAYGDASLAVAEADLALEEEDLQSILLGQNLRNDVATVKAIMNITGGWPVATQFALRALERSSDLERISTMTREIAFSFLADQVFGDLEDDRREFLTAMAFAGSLDADLIRALGYSNPHTHLDWLRGSPVPIHESAGGLRLHDLFGEFVRRICGDEDRAACVSRVGDALMHLNRFSAAVDFYRLYAHQHVWKVLESHGFALLDAGRWETVEETLPLAGAERLRSNPTLLGLRGALEVFGGSFERAEGFYHKAITLADSVDLRTMLSSRLSLLYSNRSKPESLTVIEPMLNQGTERMQCESRSAYAYALVITGNPQTATQEILAAIAQSEELGDDGLVAKLHMRAAWVYFHAGDGASAERHGLEAIRLAERVGDYATYMYAHGILASCADLYHDDQVQALWHTHQMALGATRAGNRQVWSFALRGEFYMEAERGRLERLEAIERDLGSHAFSYRDSYFFTFAQSMRLGWGGRFAEGLRKLQSLDGRIVDPSENRCWRASIALFQAFAGKDNDAKKTLDTLGRALSTTSFSARGYECLADIYAAFAEIFIGRSSAATRRLSGIAVRRKMEHTFVGVARDLISCAGNLRESILASIVESLRASQNEGFANLLAAAYASRPNDTRVASLTEAEMGVLRALSTGQTTKQIASLNDRSVETIRSQLKSIYQKLGVSGQVEALATARRLGILP